MRFAGAAARHFGRHPKADTSAIWQSGQARDNGRIAEAARLAAGNGARALDNSKINEIYRNYRNGKTPIETVTTRVTESKGKGNTNYGI